jgi:cobaltochelatase CobN
LRDAVGADKWQEVFEVYVKDKYEMDLTKFFDAHNPWAYQSLTARMLEAVRKGYWQPDEQGPEAGRRVCHQRGPTRGSLLRPHL